MTARLKADSKAAIPLPAAELAAARLPDITKSTFDYLPAALAGYSCGVGVVTMLFWGIAHTALMASWLTVFVALCGMRLWVWLAFRRALQNAPAVPMAWRVWLRRSNIGTLVAGAFWGFTGWAFYAEGGGLQQTGLIIIVYTFSVVGIPVLSIQPRMYLAFAALSFAPMVLRIATVGNVYSYQLAAELVLIMTLTTILAGTYRKVQERVIDLKVQAQELLNQLRIEKQAAESARQEAEVANRAKTQFFAAASHDLRQPLHAMGLFAEALRQRVHEPEVTQLVNSINESVDALEGLFSELLDITRIDAGGVEVQAQHFSVRELLRKLRLNFEPQAFEKGLAFRTRGLERTVFADPLLVERILRNLVSNAIRYTNKGTVLVSCRQRQGQVLLQVWDTGIGIRETECQRIFEEFYQVPHTHTVNPEQRKGLGLGLAIVKRLADLMQAPLTVRSAPEHGTVFTLTLPVGSLPRSSERVTWAPPSASVITLHGRRVVVVEDEPAVRAGLEVLLKSWGAEVASFESLAACAVWVQATSALTMKPDLLIVDYRLEEGCTGLNVLQIFRERFGPSIPAIVVTGSTMVGHEDEALQHNFHLLIKPVVPNKLRAMISFKLGVRAGR